MSATFDNDIVGQSYSNRMEVVRYDTSGTSYQWLAGDNTDDFDLWDDGATAGDWIAFGWDRAVWHDLTLNVGTAASGGGSFAITVAWEFHNGSAWTALTVTDNTVGFTVAGVNSVTFSVPDNWKLKARLNGSYGCSAHWIRCRLVSVTDMTEGGAHADDYVTGLDYAIMLTDAGNTPATMQTANDGGSWGVMTNPTAYLYMIDCNVRFDGAGSPAFAAEFCEIILGAFTDGHWRQLLIPANAEFRLGNKTGNELSVGCSLTIWCDRQYEPYNYWAGTVKLYVSRLFCYLAHFNNNALNGVVDIQQSTIEVYNVNIFFIGASTTGTIRNTAFVLRGSGKYLYVYAGLGLVLQGNVIADGEGILLGANGAQVSDMDFTYPNTKYLRNANSATVYALDCVILDYSTQITSITAGVVWVRYTLDFRLIDKRGNLVEGAYLRVADKDGNPLIDEVVAHGTTDAVIDVWKNDAGVTTDYGPFQCWVFLNGKQVHYERFELTYKSRLRQIPLAAGFMASEDVSGVEWR